jgi:uncharacterized protein YjdB
MLVLHQGKSSQVGALIFDKKGHLMAGTQPTSWISDNVAVATVDANGLVTGVTPGSAGVTALFDRLVSNVVAVTVTVDNTPASIEVTPGTVSVTVGQTFQLTAVVKNGSGDPV